MRVRFGSGTHSIGDTTVKNTEKDRRESAKIAGECWKSAKKRLAEKRQARAKSVNLNRR